MDAFNKDIDTVNLHRPTFPLSPRRALCRPRRNRTAIHPPTAAKVRMYNTTV